MKVEPQSDEMTSLHRRGLLQDQTHSLNIPSNLENSPAISKGKNSFKKPVIQATTKAIYRHLQLTETRDVQSPPRKQMARLSAQKAVLKTTDDFRGMGMLDSQIDSQTWLDNLVHEEMSPAPDSEEESHGCTHCDALRTELQRAHDAHLETIGDHDRLVAQLQDLREAVAYAGAKLLESVGVVERNIDNDFEE